MKSLALAHLLIAVTAAWPSLPAEGRSLPHALTWLGKVPETRFRTAVRDCTEAYTGEISSLSMPKALSTDGSNGSDRIVARVVVDRALRGSATSGQTLTVVVPSNPRDGCWWPLFKEGRYLLFLLSSREGQLSPYNNLCSAVVPVSRREPKGTEPKDFPELVERELMNSLDDADQETVMWAIVRLGDLGRKTAEPSLKRFLGSKVDALRRCVVFSLLSLGDMSVSKEAVDYVLSPHEDKSDRLLSFLMGRAEETDVILRVRDPAVIPQLCRILKAPDNKLAKMSALETMMRLYEESAIPCVGEALNDPEDDVRRMAVSCLALLTGDYEHGATSNWNDEVLNYWRNKVKTLVQK